MKRNSRLWRPLALLVSCVFSLIVAESVLRILPLAPSASEIDPSTHPSPFVYGEPFGFEIKPYGLIRAESPEGPAEHANSDGFRGPERILPRPDGVFRILALGDSVVEALTVTQFDSWTNQLEELLNRWAISESQPERFEVVNSGIGGYVSRQALWRLRNRGAKYQPNLVLVLVGWNDLFFSSLPDWNPDWDLTNVEQAYLDGSSADDDPSLLSQLWRGLAARSVFFRHLRSMRSKLVNRANSRSIIRHRQQPSGIPFNQPALDLYRQHLLDIREATIQRDARLAVILWPSLLTMELAAEPRIQEKLLQIYFIFPLSTLEILEWHSRYQEAQRELAVEHPDVRIIDAGAGFQRGLEERLPLFTDLAHLTREGNRRLAEIVANELTKARLLE